MLNDDHETVGDFAERALREKRFFTVDPLRGITYEVTLVGTFHFDAPIADVAAPRQQHPAAREDTTTPKE